MKGLSRNAQMLMGQPMFQVIDAVKKLEQAGRDVVHFEIGEPDFETPEHIVAAGISALDAGETHYVSSWGISDFIEASRRATEKSRKFVPDIDQVLVTPGANIAIYMAIVCLMEPGDEILVPDPGFPTYLASARAAGVTAVPYALDPDDDFRLNADNLEAAITPRTRMIIVNSPSNPTGAVTAESELRKIYSLAERHDLFIFSDEIYARMVFDGTKFFSLGTLDACRERVIISNGFSKAFAMTGWRLGIMIGPSEVMAKMMLLLQTTLSCVPPFIQRAGVAALEGPQEPVWAMMREYAERRDFVVSRVNEIPGMSTPVPGGAFYLFPSIQGTGLSSTEFADRLLDEEAVAVLPGTNFGERGEGFIRISYASGRERLEEGLQRIKNFSQRLVRQ